MKKAIFASIIFMMCSFFASAIYEVSENPGDPKKKQEEESFNLSQGYFSLFNFFNTEKPLPDTVRTSTSSMVPFEKRKEGSK